MHDATPQSTCPDAERQAEARLAEMVDPIALPLKKARAVVGLLPLLDGEPGWLFATLLYIVGDYLDDIHAALDGETSSGE